MLNSKLNLKNIINICIKTLITALLGLAIINIFILKDNISYDFNYKIIIPCLILYIAIIMLAIFLKNKYNKKTPKWLKIVLWTLLIGIQIGYVVILYRQIGFDCGVVIGSAKDLIAGNFDNVQYFSTYTNNMFLLLFFEICFRLAHLINFQKDLMVAIMINIIAIDVAIWLIAKVCIKIFGEKYSFISYIISVPILGITPYIAVAYTDTLSLPFTVGLFYGYICYKQNKKTKYLIYITICGIIGLLIKPTNIIILIAIILIELINLIMKIASKTREKIDIKICLKNTLAIVLTAIIIYGGFSVYKQIRLGKYITKEDIENNSFSMTHFFMMGLKPTEVEGKYYGHYNQDDVDNTAAHIGKEAKKEYNISEAKNRLKNMGVKGYISFLYDKYTWIISDGTFFYGNEGHFYTTEPFFKEGFAKLVQDYSYQGREGYRNVTVNILQTYWCAVLILITLGTIIKFIKKEKDEINILRLSVIGIIAFILLFEARSRYLINYLPIMIILAVYGAIEIYQKVANIKIPKKQLAEGKEDCVSTED